MVSITNETNIFYMFGKNVKISFDSYRILLFEDTTIIRAFFVSTSRVIAGVTLNLLFTSLLAYPLSRKYLPHRNKLNFYIVIPMLFSGGLIPTYLLVSSLKFIDSYWVYIIPGLINAWYAIILRNFFQSVPDSMEESAKIDGASDLLILFRIILPLSAPALATLGLFYAVDHWNAWFDAILYIRSPKKYPLQIFLRRLAVEQSNIQNIIQSDIGKRNVTPESIKCATLLITTVPIMLVYPFLQKYFAKGIMIGAIKG